MKNIAVKKYSTLTFDERELELIQASVSDYTNTIIFKNPHNPVIHELVKLKIKVRD